MMIQNNSVLPSDLPLTSDRSLFEHDEQIHPHQEPWRRNRYSAPAFLIVGFLVCIGILVGFMSYGSLKLEQNQARVDAAVAELTEKIDLVNTMRNNARERTVSLYAMVNEEDPFEQDEIFLRFNEYGFNFLTARKKLLTMNLDPVEKRLLEKQSNLTKVVVPIQDQIVDLVKNEKVTDAIGLLTSDASALQNKTLQVLIDLQAYEKELVADMARINLQKRTDTKRTIFILAALGAFLSLLIAIYVIRHITKIERRLYLEKELAELTLHSIGDAVITTDNKSKITSMNPRAEQLTGWTMAQAKGESLTHVFNIISEETAKPIFDPAVKALNLGKTIYSTQDEVLVNSNGFRYAIEHAVSPVYDIHRRQLGSVIIFRDETETRALSTQLSYQASHEMLTGLTNRRAFEKELEECFQCYAQDGNSYVMAYILVEQFQLISDTCGHLACDELLRQVSKILKQNVPENSTLARIGGGEFAVLYKGYSVQEAEKNATLLLTCIEQFRFAWKGQSFDVVANIGIAAISSLTNNLSELFNAADSACYLAKNKGRNTAYVYQPNDRELERHRGEMLWLQQINQSLKNDGFLLYYQPIHSTLINSSGSEYFEILLRMRDESGNVIPPMAFIPAAERSHLMPDIDKWVVHNALAEIKQIILYSNANDSLPLFSINLSGQSITDTKFQDYVLSEISQANLPAGVLCIEITETAAITNLSSAVGFIKRLRLAGCRFALDDFGSGLSLFSYLKNLTIDYIKIDDGFIRDICNDITDRVFVESVVQICRIMNIKTVAEGVENRHILEEIRRVGVNYAQGYYIDAPIPLSKFTLVPEKKISVS